MKVALPYYDLIRLRAADLSPQSPLELPLASKDADSHYAPECSVINPQHSRRYNDDSLGPLILADSDTSGHVHSVQNITRHQAIPDAAHQTPPPMSLLHFPPELVTRILLCLSPLDIISCGRTCRVLYHLCSDSTLRYLVQMERCAVSDELSPGLSYPERLRILERREEAWAMLEFRRSVVIPIPFNPTTQHEFTGGALLLGTAPDGRSRQPTFGHSYVTLPSLSEAEAQDQKLNLDWKAYNLETRIIDVGLAVHEQDLIAALTV